MEHAIQESVEIREQSQEIMQMRNPTPEDVGTHGKYFSSGQKWVNVATGEVWVLFTQLQKNNLLQYWVQIKKATKE